MIILALTTLSRYTQGQDSNHNGSYGWKSYKVELYDRKTDERFTAYLKIQFHVSLVNHKKHMLRGSLPAISYAETLDTNTRAIISRGTGFPPTRLRNADGEIILQVSE